jgi:CheY-like chemotaxis protein
LNETLEQQVAERTELAEARSRQLQSLAVEVIEAEERERQRIAELLHEDLQQILASARMQLQAASATAPPEPMIGNVEWLLEESIRKSRNLSHELSPPILHHSDLITALKALALQMAEQFGLFAEFKTEVQSPEVNPSIKTFFFRAVQELLFNVTKHAGVTKAQILLAGNKDTIAVTVSDDGQGFDPAILVTAGARSGLGLLSLRERASYIGGRLQIESAPGKGSRLTLTVPRNLVGRQASQFPTIEQQPHPRFKPPVRKSDSDIQVLFADDHKVMRQGLIKLISGKPDIHVVGEAANGREALELARQNRPDVIVMDVSMPDMDGIEATRRIKAELPQVRVIGLSMHEDEKLAQTMRQAGAENFVSKTASSSILLKAIYGI